MNRKLWIRAAGAAIAVAALAFVVHSLVRDLNALTDAIAAPNLWFYGGAAMVIAMMLVFPLLWVAILRGVGIEMPLRQCYAIWWVTNLGKYVPGKAWMVLGRVYLAREHGKARVLESFAWEFVVSVSSAVIAGCVLFLIDGPHMWMTPIVVAAALASLIPVASPRLVQKVLHAPLKWIGRGDWTEPPRMHRGPYLVALGLAIAIWLLWGIAHGLMLRGIGLDVPYWAVTGAFALAWVLGYVAIILPAGLGVREGAIHVLLGPLMVVGGAALLALMSRAVTVVAELLAGLVGVAMWHRDRRLNALRPSVPEGSVGADGTPGTPREDQG